jgi:hypothetical protein
MANTNTKAKSLKDPVVDHVVSEFERYEMFHRARFQEAREAYDFWSNKPIQKEYSWMNSVTVPVMLEGEQTITPKLFTALFPTDAPLDVTVEGDAPEEQGVRIKGILKHYFRVTNVQGEALRMLTQNTLYGTGYMEAGGWKVKKGWVTDQQTGNSYHSTIEARPHCEFVSFFELFPHPAKKRVDDGLPVIRRRVLDAEALKKAAKDSHFEASQLKEALDSLPPKGSGVEYNPKKEREYEILEYWGPWDDTIYRDEKQVTREAVPYWIIIVNRTVKIRCLQNPYDHQMPPYVKVKLFEDPQDNTGWFGVGIGKAGLPTAHRLNKIVNQRLDNVDLVLNKQGLYNGNDTLINTKKLQISKPGQFHKVSDTVTSIKWMETPDVTGSSYKEEEIAKQDFREATGATSHLMPEQGTEHRTAMGIQLLQGTAGVRFRPIIRQLEIDFIQALAMFFFSNLKQFMTEAEWVQITGKNGEIQPVQVTPEQIQAKVFFIPTGMSETIEKETMIGQLLRYKEVTMNDPTVNRQEINKRIAELMGFKDIHKLLTPIAQGQIGGLTGEQQLHIQQRVAEGATPEQIKAEMLGNVPQPDGAGGGAYGGPQGGM